MKTIIQVVLHKITTQLHWLLNRVRQQTKRWQPWNKESWQLHLSTENSLKWCIPFHQVIPYNILILVIRFKMTTFRLLNLPTLNTYWHLVILSYTQYLLTFTYVYLCLNCSNSKLLNKKLNIFLTKEGDQH
jgi:hypothetical protein